MFTAVPFHGFGSADEFEPIIDEFVAVARRAIDRGMEYQAGAGQRMGGSALLHGRPLPLLAMPVLGASGGGGAAVIGDLIQTILKAATVAAERHQVDIVLVVRDAAQLALAQRIRRSNVETGWSELNGELKAMAGELARDAIAGKIVPFMGAGVSMSAGAPSWGGLVDGLAVGAGLTSSERQRLSGKNVLDQAEILLNVYGDQAKFNLAVAERVEVERYGLAPTLLASLPLEQAITLNYDTLFEKASEDAGAPCAVIPSPDDGGSDDAATRWLLKMHGSVTDQDSIVLTRDDYLGFDANRNVLAALVKASLVTKRLVFVGFGLGDDHFHQIVHDVRAVEPGKISRNAVALTLSRDSLDERAWAGKLQLCPMTAEDTDPGTAGRILEVFLDYVLALSTDSREYLLDEAFASQLTDDERLMKGGLLALQSALQCVDRNESSASSLRAGFKSFGLGMGDHDETGQYSRKVASWKMAAVAGLSQLDFLVDDVFTVLSAGPTVLEDYEYRQWESEEGSSTEAEIKEINEVLEQVRSDLEDAENATEELYEMVEHMRDQYEKVWNEINYSPDEDLDIP
ncbi:SIR2 family NAD-dependent protein deacylase [Brevibacterium moorei]|uniref:SIR2 family NAD-dependent protein deacylase n=1 Tax=Brevibacterium moorei TaxID=2968457 RepID=UPI00211C57F1